MLSWKLLKLLKVKLNQDRKSGTKTLTLGIALKNISGTAYRQVKIMEIVNWAVSVFEKSLKKVRKG